MKYQNKSKTTKFVKVNREFVSVAPDKIFETEIVDLHLRDSDFVLFEEKEKPKKEPKVDKFDLNNDGKVDKKDTKLAAQVLGSSKKRKPKSKKPKKRKTKA